MSGGKPAATRDRATFPALRERLGEDPARWLDREIVDSGTSMVLDRIESIDDLEVIRAWKAVERNLGRGRGGDPRSGVMSALEEREQTLEEHGERWERLDRPSPDERVTESASCGVEWSDRDDGERDTGVSLVRQSQRGRAATDGGESE
jgi:hypothetical protein